MNISKKQLDFIDVLERCGGMYRHEVYEVKYPHSMINALIEKELVVEFKNKLTSATK